MHFTTRETWHVSSYYSSLTSVHSLQNYVKLNWYKVHISATGTFLQVKIETSVYYTIKRICLSSTKSTEVSFPPLSQRRIWLPHRPIHPFSSPVDHRCWFHRTCRTRNGQRNTTFHKWTDNRTFQPTRDLLPCRVPTHFVHNFMYQLREAIAIFLIHGRMKSAAAFPNLLTYIRRTQ